MRILGLLVVALAVGACKKTPKPEGTAGSAAGSAVVAIDAAVGAPTTGSAASMGSGSGAGSGAEAGSAAGSAAGSGAGSSEPAAPSATVDGTTATLTYPRAQLKLTMTLPDGWALAKQDSSFIFTPGGKGDRPSIDVFKLGGVDPSPKDIATEFAKTKKDVIGGGKLKVLTSGDLPNGKFLSRHVDAKKERGVVYVETTCWVGKPDSKWTIRMTGFAEEKDAALVKSFEDVCHSMKFVEP